MKIEKGKLVALQYELDGYDENPDEREDIEKTEPGRPFQFIYGMETVLPAFEKQFEGLSAGDKFDFELAPAEAYGEYQEGFVKPAEKKFFCDKNGRFLSEYVKVGEVLNLTVNGQPMTATVEEITDTHVVCDFNHPLAGMTLRWKGEVVEVREPTEEDKKAYMRECEGGCHCKGGECDGNCDCDNKEKDGGKSCCKNKE